MIISAAPYIFLLEYFWLLHLCCEELVYNLLFTAYILFLTDVSGDSFSPSDVSGDNLSLNDV